MFAESAVATMKIEFSKKLEKLINRKRNNSIYLITRIEYQNLIKEVKAIMQKTNKSFEDYKMLSNYDILTVCNKERLIMPRNEINVGIKFYVATDELFGVLHTIHLLFRHADKNEMDTEIKTKYCNVSKEVIKIYLGCCKICQDKNVKQS